MSRRLISLRSSAAGTAYLEVALTEPLFVNQFLRGKDPQKIEQFRTSVHRVSLARPIRTRFEARSTLANVAAMAQEQIGLPPRLRSCSLFAGL